MVIMGRSRSPLRSSPPSDGARPLVNFPVWNRPMDYGATPQGKGQQVVHSMESRKSRSTGHSGVTAFSGIYADSTRTGRSFATFIWNVTNSDTHAHAFLVLFSWTSTCPSSSSSSRHGLGWHDANFSTSSTIVGSSSCYRTVPGPR